MRPFERVGASPALRLGAGDNVAIAVRDIAAGTRVTIDATTVTLADAVKVGHKFAVEPIRAGDRIVKYGAPIGRATRDILPGEHVHLHNVASDYLPTYTLDAGHRFLEEGH